MLNKYAGFGLIEVMVALFIVTTVLLSLLKLISVNIDNQSNVFYETKATILVNDLAERILLNKTKQYLILKDANMPEQLDESCIVQSCNVNQLMQFDINQWLYHVKKQLPDSKGYVENKNGLINIVVLWNQSSLVKKIEMEFKIE